MNSASDGEPAALKHTFKVSPVHSNLAYLFFFASFLFSPLIPPLVVRLFQAETLRSLTPPRSSPLRNSETSAATPATSPVELLIQPIKFCVCVFFFLISHSLTCALLPPPPSRLPPALQ